jgi:tRNA threonylcarbamoyladenosine biosynthesis protein TsaB
MPMKILALDTGTSATVAALVDTETGLELEARDDPPAGARPSHASQVLGLVQQVLVASPGGWGAIDRIAVGLGPGTFTGLRIGVATAQALARSQARPLVGILTLDALARGAVEASETLARLPLAVIDARRGEAFASGPGIEPCVLAPEQLGQIAAGRVAVGDGALKFRAVLEAGGATVPGEPSVLHRVSALWHCRLAETAEPRPLNQVQPQYLRVPDAELNRRP